MLGLGGHAQLPQLLVHLVHVGADALADHAEVVVLQLLALGRHRAEQGPAGVDQILALHVLGPVHQEILLLRSHGGGHALGRGVAEQPQDSQGLLVDRLHGAQQRGFLVQRLALVGAEGGGDTKGHADGVLPQKRGGGAVPGRVASGLKGGPQAPGGEGGGVRLALDQLFPGKFHDHPAVAWRGDKGIVFLRGHAGEGLKPVGIMGGSPLDGPILHGVGHNVGDAGIQLRSVLDCLLQFLINTLWKAVPHHGIVKYVPAEHIGHIHYLAHRLFHPLSI